MNTKKQLLLWLHCTRSRFFLIPEKQELPTGDFILFNLTSKKKTVAPTTLTPFEITEEEAREFLENELNQLMAQIEVSEDIQKELPKMLEEIFSDSNIEKHLPEIINKLVDIEDQIEQYPELLIQIIHDFFTSLSQEFFIEQEKQLEQNRQEEYRKSAKDAIAKSLSSFTVPSFADRDWFSEISLLPKDEQK